MSYTIPSYLPQIYPMYSLLVFLLAIILSFIGIIIGINIDTIFKSLDEKKESRTKQILLLQCFVQIGLCALFSYFAREIVDTMYKTILGSYVVGNPSKYAIIIMAPSMFIPQRNLVKKLKYTFNL